MPPGTAKEAAKRIYEITAVKRSPTQVREYMHKIGMKPLKIAQIPAKTNPTQQKEFLQEKLEPKIEEAKEEKEHCCF